MEYLLATGNELILTNWRIERKNQTGSSAEKHNLKIWTQDITYIIPSAHVFESYPEIKYAISYRKKLKFSNSNGSDDNKRVQPRDFRKFEKFIYFMNCKARGIKISADNPKYNALFQIGNKLYLEVYNVYMYNYMQNKLSEISNRCLK